MKPYRVIVVGMGKRGMHHAQTFAANPRFELAGICDIDPARLAAAAPKLGNPKTSTDASQLAKELQADVFCFCTLPNLRLPLIQLGIATGAKLIAFEKPVAMSSTEGIAIKQALHAAGVKAVVAESFARIFFRNSVATGELYPFDSGLRLCDIVKTSDEATLDFDHDTLTVNGKTYQLKPLGDVRPVIDAGGLFNYARQSGMIAAK